MPIAAPDVDFFDAEGVGHIHAGWSLAKSMS
jgi:hypothetical protein